MRLMHVVPYLAVRTLAMVVMALPVRVALAAARALGWLTFAVDARHRRRALENVRRAYRGELDERACRRIVLGAFQHMYLVGVELMHFRRIAAPQRWRRRTRWIGREHVEQAAARGRGIIFVTGHVGIWEFSSRCITQEGYPMSVIARPVKNPMMERFLLSLREGYGQTVIAKDGALLACARVARAGGVLGFVADQSAGAEGVFVDFFGRPASTHKSVAAMCLKFGMPIVTGCCFREGPMRFVAHADPPIVGDPKAGRDAEIVRITQAYTKNLEMHVRRHPEQYVWMHRRWKHRPDGTREA